MKCPVCVKEEKKSQVYPGQCTSTCMAAMPYYDEDGQYHNHVPNTTTTYYSCSNRHRFVINSRSGCSYCNAYPAKNETTILESIPENGTMTGGGVILVPCGGLGLNTLFSEK